MIRHQDQNLTRADVTPKVLFLNRRQLIAAATGAAAFAATGRAFAASSPYSTDAEPTSLEHISSYNNYYEFGYGKDRKSVV